MKTERFRAGRGVNETITRHFVDLYTYMRAPNILQIFQRMPRAQERADTFSGRGRQTASEGFCKT